MTGSINNYAKGPSIGQFLVAIIVSLLKITPVLIIGLPLLALFDAGLRSKQKLNNDYKGEARIIEECRAYAKSSTLERWIFPSNWENSWCRVYTGMVNNHDDMVSRIKMRELIEKVDREIEAERRAKD